MASDDEEESRSVVALAVGAYLFLSGLYHLLDGGLMAVSGLGNNTLNVLFASLSIILGFGLMLSSAGLFAWGSGGWYLGAGLVTLFTVMLDMMSVLLREGTAAKAAPAIDALLLLASLVVIVRGQSGEDSRADMDKDESVHDIGRDF